MIISFSDLRGGGGGLSPEEIQQMIDVSLEEYWTSGETDEHITSAITSLDLDFLPLSGGTMTGDITKTSGSTTYYVPYAAAKTVGNTNVPVMLSGGTLVECKHFVRSQSGAYNTVPFVGSDGVMEIGTYVDFHSNSADTSDFDIRLSDKNHYLTYRHNGSRTSSGFPSLSSNETIIPSSATIATIWTGTQAQYNALSSKDSHTLYITTD